MNGYDSNSCNALEKPFYTPVEAALRWCNLIEQEGFIFSQLEAGEAPAAGAFPQWPCLRANTEKILDAIMNDGLPYGRDGRSVPPGEQVARPRLTIRHADLKDWMSKRYPDQKPAFLYDEIERNTHSAINKDSFTTLQANNMAQEKEIETKSRLLVQLKSENTSLMGENLSLKAMIDNYKEPISLSERKEATYQAIIGALLFLLKEKPKQNRTQDSIADEIEELFNASGLGADNLKRNYFSPSNKALEERQKS